MYVVLFNIIIIKEDYLNLRTIFVYLNIYLKTGVLLRNL